MTQNKEPIDFLNVPSDRRLRREIQNIIDSYSHPWDIISELIQNSVDAIRQYEKLYGDTYPKKHEIEIMIDASKRFISIRDTGIGFPSNSFSELLAPHGTDKDGDPYTIGEKGVGLTYTIFMCNRYEISTCSTTAKIEGFIENAASWRRGASVNIPKFTIIEWTEDSFIPKDTYTLIKLFDVEQKYTDEDDLFQQSPSIIEFILRTKTAIGWVKNQFGGEALPVQITLIIVDSSGQKTSNQINPEYLFPHQVLDNGTVDLENFKRLAANLDDRQKSRRLQGKAIIKKGCIDRGGKRINYYTFFAPSRQLWKDISEKFKFFKTNEQGERQYLFEGGIFIATRGMPTGIQLEPPSTGYAGYWPNFLILLEDDSITFDLGRKSIPGRTKGILREIAKTLFNEFIPVVGYATSDPPVTSVSSTIQYAEKTKEFENLKKLPDINLSRLPYLKYPDGQEAAVVAIFHEMVAAGILRGYHTLRTGYRQTYDLWGIYSVTPDCVGKNFQNLANANGRIELPIVVEFKHNAEDILDDALRNIKYFGDIDLIVCWDFDENAFARQNVTVEAMPVEDVLFNGTNFRLIWPAAYNLGPYSEKPLISLRRLIHDLQSSS